MTISNAPSSSPAFLKSREQAISLNLDHVKTLTDDTGLIQHAIFTVPNRSEGYSIDDNARALILMVLLDQWDRTHAKTPDPVYQEWSSRYLAFLEHALNPANGRFRNFMSYDRRWLEDQGSEDSHGRSLWALGTLLARSANAGLKGAAERLFERALPVSAGMNSPRACAYVLLGIHEYLSFSPKNREAQKIQFALSGRLLNAYTSNRSAEWKWFENILAYGNARLSQALILVGSACADEPMFSAGLESLAWLMEAQRCPSTGHFVPIGSEGFHPRGGVKARFDQQPVEAAGAVSACLDAYRITGDAQWRDRAQSAFNWFLGDNDLQLPLYDAETGGCRDGLHPDRVNQNQGAESTLSFLTAFAEMRTLQNETTI